MAYFALLLYTAVLFIRPQEWVSWMLGMPVLDYVVGFAVIAWLAHLLSTEWRVKDAPQNLLVLGLFAAVLMSHVRHTYLAALQEEFQVFGKVVLIYFLIASTADSTRRIKGLILVIVLGCLFMSAHGILQAHRGYGFGGAVPIVRNDLVRVRAMGIFHDPNDLSLMLVAVMPFLLSAALDRESSIFVRVGSLAAVVPMVYCVYLTDSRGGWLALAVMAMAFVFVHLRNKKIGILLAVLAVPLVFALGPSRVDTITTEDGSVRGRTTAWGYGNWMLKRWPLFGAGKGRFVEFSPEGLVAHNSFVHCWGELGLFGYFFWLGLVLASFKDCWALGRASPETDEGKALSRLGRAGVASLAGFMSAAFFLSRTYIIPLYILFGLFAAMHTVYEKQEAELPGLAGTADWKYLLVIELLSIPGLWLLIRILNM